MMQWKENGLLNIGGSNHSFFVGKTLANGLNNSPEIHLPKEVIQESIVSLGVPENIRGEALSLEQFAELSNEIGQRMKK